MNRWLPLKAWTFSIPLTRTLVVPPHALTSREGLMIRLEDDEGNAGLGEICPLPGLHSETYEEAREQVSQLRDAWEDIPVDDSFLQAMSRCSRLSERLQLVPSVRFGLTMALAHVWMARESCPLFALLGRNGPATLPLQALLTAPLEGLLDEAGQRWERGYRAFKVKVGRLSLEEDLRRIVALHERFGADARLRLDANRRWSLPQAVEFAAALGDLPVDYYEEPLSEPSELPSFRAQTGARYALDESLRELLPEEHSEVLVNASAIVIKPNLLRGWRGSQRWLTWAEERGLPAVFSSSFETGVGLSFLAQWAAATAAPQTPQGLDTASWLEDPLWEGWQSGGEALPGSCPLPSLPASHPYLKPLG